MRSVKTERFFCAKNRLLKVLKNEIYCTERPGTLPRISFLKFSKVGGMFKPLPRLNLTPFSVFFAPSTGWLSQHRNAWECNFWPVPCHDCLMLSANLIIVLPVYRMHPLADRAACRWSSCLMLLQPSQLAVSVLNYDANRCRCVALAHSLATLAV